MSVDYFFEQVNAFTAKIFFFDVLFFVEGVQFPAVVFLLSISAVFFTLKMNFVNLRLFKQGLRLAFGNNKKASAKEKGEASSFKALATALSATVGLGNIAGVAIAISVGGPGAAFWMIIMGFLGMSTKFTECTLAIMYREKRPDGHIMGGPMEYLKHGLKDIGWPVLGKTLSVIFCFLCIIASFGGGAAFQVNQSLNAIGLNIPFLLNYKWIYGLLMVFLVGLVIIGGIKRIASTASRVVPFMCVVYVLMALYTLVLNYQAVPGAFLAIVEGAFNPKSAYGGLLGVLVIGMKRAVFSNEAGLGSAPIAHSIAQVNHPVEEGSVALLGPFIDTILICTMTALVMIITGAYENPQYIDLISQNKGAALTSRALSEQVSWFPHVLSTAVFLFAFSTIISWSYYGERCFSFLFGDRFSLVYKVLLLGIVFFSALASAANILEFGDLMILGMSFPNLIGLLFLSGKVKQSLKEYMQKIKNE